MNYSTHAKTMFVALAFLVSLFSYAEETVTVASPEADAVEDMKALIQEKWKDSYIDSLECHREESVNPEVGDIFLSCESTFFAREEVLPPGQGQVEKYEYGCGYYYKTIPNGSGFIRSYVECAM